jgi:hypothetical protein
VRRKRTPIPCEECGASFKPHRTTTRFCSVACRRAVDARVCRSGHDLTLPGATRRQKGGTASRCVECERLAGERYRRRIGRKPRAEHLIAVRLDPAEKRRRNAERATKYRRLAGVKERATAVRREPPPRAIPNELSKAWGRAGYGSMLRRKYPTRESLIRAYNAGELPRING